MTTATAFRPGTVLKVRAYETGRETGFRDAVVLGDYMDRDALWYFNQGAPENGITTQPLYRDSHYSETGLTVVDLPTAKLRKLAKELNREGGDVGPLGEHLAELRVQIVAELRARFEGRR